MMMVRRQIKLSMDTLAERVAFLLKLRGLSQAEAARRGGFSNATFIYDILKGKKLGVQGANLAKLALGLSTTAEFLLRKTEDPELPGESAAPARTAPQIERSDFALATYGGVVEAGAFREVNDFADDTEDHAPIYEPRDPRFPQAQLVYFMVAGDSMNALRPRPLMPGDRVIGVDFEGLGGRVPLDTGLVVVIEQTMQGGHHRERSVKQVELYEDRIEFHPRSTNPKHKPIVVPVTVFRDPSEEDQRTVRILAIVRRVSADIPL